MSERGEADEPLTPAEERLVRLLVLLRVDLEGRDVTGPVLRTAQWQLLVRGVLRAAGATFGAAGDAVSVLFGLRSRPPERGS